MTVRDEVHVASDMQIASVAVIVAVRDGAETIAACIESVTAQRGCSIELVIVDGMSTDGTDEIVRMFGDDVSRYIREQDAGICDAWNKALRVITSQWCIFLGSDDCFLSSDSVLQLIACAERARSASQRLPVLIYGGVIRRGGAADYVVHPAPAQPVRFLRAGRMLPHQGLLHDVAALRAAGGFDIRLRLAGDRDAALRTAKRGSIVRCDAVVAVMHTGGLSSQRSSQFLLQREVASIVRRERGVLFATWRFTTGASYHFLGYIVERFTLRALGDRRGRTWILAVRRMCGLPPKLIS